MDGRAVGQVPPLERTARKHAFMTEPTVVPPISPPAANASLDDVTDLADATILLVDDNVQNLELM